MSTTENAQKIKNNHNLLNLLLLHQAKKQELSGLKRLLKKEDIQKIFIGIINNGKSKMATHDRKFKKH